MKRIAVSLFAVFFLLSCAGLPEITPPDAFLPGAATPNCPQPFVQKKWQFVHAVKAELPDGRAETMIGTVIVSPGQKALHCVLTTIEGIVLFEAVHESSLHVIRALPPLDSDDMSARLMHDIQLIFLEPTGRLIETGRLNDHAAVCRYREDNGATVDIAEGMDGDWTLYRYNRFSSLTHTVRAQFSSDRSVLTPDGRIPGRMELTGHGLFEYKLVLDLLDSVCLRNGNKNSEP